MKRKRFVLFGIALLLMVIGGAVTAGLRSARSQGLDGMENSSKAYLKDSDLLVSSRFKRPTAQLLSRPVIIVVQEYATSTEWKEFRSMAEASGNVLVSQVLLSGKSQEKNIFEHTTWEEWEKPILSEYRALNRKGYRHISLAGASEGATLLIHGIASGNYRASKKSPEHVFLIDPYLIPKDKTLAMASYWKLFRQEKRDNHLSLETQKWYNWGPSKSLIQLSNLIEKVSKELDAGVVLPTGSDLIIYQSMGDPVSNPKGAVLIQDHLHDVSGNVVKIEWVNSRHHVFTQRVEKDGEWGQEDQANQERVFKDIITALMPSPNPLILAKRNRHSRRRLHR